jgi:hypothetical protein
MRNLYLRVDEAENTGNIHGISIFYKHFIRGGHGMRKTISILIIVFMIIATLSGCGMLQKLGLQQKNNDEDRKSVV